MKRLIALILTTTLLFVTAAQAKQKEESLPPPPSMKTKQEKLSYALGFTTGQAYRKRNLFLSPAVFSRGALDALAAQKPALSPNEMKGLLVAFQKENIAKMQAQLTAINDKNAKAGDNFLASNKGKPGVVTTATGLQYKIITPGAGPKPTKKDKVTVNYEGKLINGKVFDSSYKRGKPVSFYVNQVIPGWQQALTMMKQGATWMLYIPAKLAYGKQGVPGAIEPNSTLVFKVQLIKVEKM